MTTVYYKARLQAVKLAPRNYLQPLQ